MSKEKTTEYPKEGPSQSGTGLKGYSVMARHNYHDPLKIAGQIFDNRWRTVNFVESNVGVPSGPLMYQAQYQACQVVGYSAAQALRWWLHAIADSGLLMGGLCLETKIINHEIKYSYECVAVSESDVVGEDHASHMHPTREESS